MKFYIVEGNIGEDATRETAEKVIEMLRVKGWDVQYGAKRNQATDVSEFGKEESIYDRFSADFLECIAVLESEPKTSPEK